jgi:hypothetical protein
VLSGAAKSCDVRTRTTLQKLGDEVRERRKKRNLSQEALALAELIAGVERR